MPGEEKGAIASARARGGGSGFPTPRPRRGETGGAESQQGRTVPEGKARLKTGGRNSNFHRCPRDWLWFVIPSGGRRETRCGRGGWCPVELRECWVRQRQSWDSP